MSRLNMLSRCFSVEKLRKIKVEHVRLKSSNQSLKYKKRIPCEVYKIRSEILCKILNCNILTAREIISKNQDIARSNQHTFHQNAEFCGKYLKLSEIIEFPSLLTLHPSILQHRYFSLRELGFYNVTARCIFRFPQILKKTPCELIKKGFPLSYEYKPDILTEYFSLSKRLELSKKLNQMYKDGSDLQKMKETINAEFFAEKLDCSIGKAHEMLYKHASLRTQSISNTNHLLNVLYKCGFSASKICSSFNLLSVHHETVEHFLSEFPEIFGVSTLLLIKRLPILLKQENDSIHKIETILKDFGINKDHLICCPKILEISPDTLQKRLTAICKLEDLAVLKANKKFLWLVYNFSTLKSRIKYLKAENIPCSIKMFTVSKDTFEKYLLYNNSRVCITETYVYIAEMFKMSEKQIFSRLSHCAEYQSENQIFSALNCRKVVEYLLLSGVTKEQIFKGLEIVYYDVDIVKIYFNRLKNHPQCQPYTEWIFHDNLIQLLIYTIEVIKYHAYEVDIDENEDVRFEFSSN